MSLSRRAFSTGLLSAALMPNAFPAAVQPRLRFGIMTDTHLTRAPKSTARVSAAFRLFRDWQCALVTHLGDLADEAWPDVHRAYRRLFDEAFADRKPRELFVYAAYDIINFVPGKSWRLTPEERDAGYDAFRQNARVPHPMYYTCDVAGVPFVTVPQHREAKRFEELLTEAEARHPTGPIFVLHHVTPLNTAFNSSRWGDCLSPGVLRRHPRVVCLSGHTHGSLANERNIWQGDFTVVDAGCLQEWGSALPGHQTKSKLSYGVLICDVFADRLVFHRLDVRDGGEIRAPWVVPLPFDPKTAPYRPSARAAQAPVPTFARDARLTLTKSKTDPAVIEISFAAAQPVNDVCYYRIEALERDVLLDWQCVAREDVYGEFYLRPSDRKGVLTCQFPSDKLNFSREIRWRVTPIGFFSQAGEPLLARLG